MSLWPHESWLELLYPSEHSLSGIHGLWNSVVLAFRVADPVLIVNLLAQNKVSESRSLFFLFSG